MKKIIFLIMLIMLMFLFTSCNVENIELSENIAAPNNTNLPITGEWIIDDYKISVISTMDEEIAETYVGTEILFDEKLVSIGEDYCLEPSFKIKNVNAEDYLIYHYKTNLEILNIDTEEIQVISVSGEEQFLNEFIKISEDRIIVNIDGVFFYLDKVSDEVDEEKIDSFNVPEDMMLKTVEFSEDETLQSGVLLGLKYLDLDNNENNDLEKWNYRTIFIRSHNKDIVSINEMEDILLPRMTGFWKIEVNRENIDDKVNDNIVAYPLDKPMDATKEIEILKEDDNIEENEEENIGLMKIEEIADEHTIKNILFLSGDYISIEDIHYRNRGQRYLEFYPIDNINNEKSMKISDIMGEVGKEAFLESFNKEIISGNEEYKDSLVDLKPNEESFGLFRRNGYWIFNGRVNYNEDGTYRYHDFNVRAFPPEELVSFDELSIPWNAIKTEVPEALDAFTSPNEDIAIILTHNNILIYQINNGNIVGEPIEKIKLKPGEKVIMSEWAMGKYSEIWEEEFTK